MEPKEWLKNRPIAHRGLHDKVVPENSMAAFRAAIEQDLAIEFDVQFTKDKVAVVFHDDDLERMTGLKKLVRKVKFADIRKLRLKGTEEQIPTLSEVLELVAGKVPLLVEIKGKSYKKNFIKTVCDMLENYSGDYAVQAFNPVAVRQVKKTSPQIFCGLLSSKFEHMKLMKIKKAGIKNARLFFIAKPDFISFEINSFPNDRIARFRNELGLPILGWTIKTLEEIERAKIYCDNIIFENITAISEGLSAFNEGIQTGKAANAY